MSADPKQPPYSIEAEQSVLGACMLRVSAIDEVASMLVTDDFYRVDHQLIYDAILALHAERKPVDFVTLSTSMEAAKTLEQAGGLSYVGTLAADTPSAVNVIAYAEIVKERAVKRALIGVGQQLADLGFQLDGKADEMLDQAEAKVLALRRSAATVDEPQSYAKLMPLVLHSIDEASKSLSPIMGLETGIAELDGKLMGLQPGDLVILAGRPSMGKTALARSIADFVAVERGNGVLMFEMEMSAEQLGYCSLANISGVPLGALRSGQMRSDQWDKMTRAQARMHKAPLYVDERGGLSPMQVRATARRYAAKHDIKLIVVDYIQLMHVPGTRENRTNEISEISRSLKALAKELKLPIIALSQLNRGVESRDNKRPRMADLRESGGLEQDADVVLFAYRDCVYNKSAEVDRGEIIVAKQRMGPLGTIEAQFEGQYVRWQSAPAQWAQQSLAPDGDDTQPPPPKRGPRTPGGYGGHRGDH